MYGIEARFPADRLEPRDALELDVEPLRDGRGTKPLRFDVTGGGNENRKRCSAMAEAPPATEAPVDDSALE